MKIHTPATLSPDQIAWEGELAAPDEMMLGDAVKGTRPAAAAPITRRPICGCG